MPRGSLKWAGLAATGFMLAACGSRHPPTSSEPGTPVPTASEQGNYKVGQPYQINGVWYSPREDWSYDETGMASWYGEAFHGRYTADGEIFDLNSLTAAHRTLPMPVVVRTTNLENGRSIELRVNDRGPYAAGRIIDVSRRAAQLLGFEGQGTAKVRVQIDVPESMKVATAAGRNGPSPSVPATAALASAPPSVPASSLEADRATGEPPPEEPPQRNSVASAPPAVPVDTIEADRAAREPYATAPPPQDRRVQVAEVPPVTSSVPPPRYAPLAPPRRADVAPPPRRVAADRPYIFNDLPDEEGAVSPERARYLTTPASSRAGFAISPVHPTQIYVQAGAFADERNAARLSSRLRMLGSPISVTAGVAGSGSPVYRVRLGPVADIDAADQLLSRVMADGFTAARIVVD